MWRQRSKALWLKEGDHNSAFFNHIASGRRCNNIIKGIKDEAGTWIADELEIEKVGLNYYMDLFISSISVYISCSGAH